MTKKCPMCKTIAHLKYKVVSTSGYRLIYIRCECGMKSEYGIDQNEAIENWNRVAGLKRWKGAKVLRRQSQAKKDYRHKRAWAYHCDLCGFEGHTIGGLQSHRYARHGLRGQRLVERKASQV